MGEFVYSRYPHEIAHRCVMSAIKWAPLGRAALWRRYDRILRNVGPIFVGHTYFGAELECSIQDLIQRMIFYFGVWEPTLSRVIETRLRKGQGSVKRFVSAGRGY